MLIPIVEPHVVAIEQTFDSLDEVADSAGFFQKGIRSGGARFVFAVGRGEKNDGRASPVRHGTRAFEQFQTVHAGHIGIEYDDVVVFAGFESAQSCPAVTTQLDAPVF